LIPDTVAVVPAVSLTVPLAEQKGRPSRTGPFCPWAPYLILNCAVILDPSSVVIVAE
jgi:hypothetical protein